MKINNLASLRRETERLEYKLKVDKSKLKTDFQLLRFRILEYAFKEVIGIFKRKPSDKRKPVEEKKSAENKEPAENQESAENQASAENKESGKQNKGGSGKEASAENK